MADFQLKFMVRFLVWMFLGLLLPACSSTLMRAAVPINLMNKVSVTGVEQVRAWGDAPIKNAAMISRIRQGQLRRNRPWLYHPTKTQEISFLALTGGGPNGAFGAGFLNGWTATGRRPEFEVVTGVSTGALIAPFAFLGSSHDKQLKEFYTLYSTNDLLTPNLISGLLGGSSVSSSAPIFALISKYIDRKFLRAVAKQHARGRRLLIGTTNLDAQRPVVWNMGQIASRGTAESLNLFRRVILASASIPGVFPPVYIDVNVGGQHFKEMHVDGGTTDNTFLLPSHFSLQKILSKRQLRFIRPKVYVIVNSHVRPVAKSVKASTFAIAARSLDTLIMQQTAGDLLQLYLRTQQNAIDFNLAAVPQHFNEPSQETFDPVYMKKLYKLGYQSALKGYQWGKRPPGY